MPSLLLVVFGVSAALSAAGTAIVRRYAISRSVLDVPNHRSSHSQPTPRGGGLSIVLVTLAGITVGWGAGWVDGHLAAALLVGGVLVASVGWFDDRRGVRAAYRAAVQFIAAAWAVGCLGGLSRLQFGTVTWQLGLLGSVAAVLMIVWLTNLYNFMDGIDGIAGANALVVASFGTLLAVRGGSTGLGIVSTLVAGTSVGFLIWNWPPARIFMGDVGSGFLGYVFGVIALASEGHGPGGVVVWLLLLGVFIFDSTVTLARRVFRRQKWYAAHRSHAYQRLVQAGRTHREVTLAVVLIDCGFGGAALAMTSGGAPFAWVVLCVATALTALYLVVERLKPMSVIADGAT